MVVEFCKQYNKKYKIKQISSSERDARTNTIYDGNSEDCPSYSLGNKRVSEFNKSTNEFENVNQRILNRTNTEIDYVYNMLNDIAFYS